MRSKPFRRQGPHGITNECIFPKAPHCASMSPKSSFLQGITQKDHNTLVIGTAETSASLAVQPFKAETRQDGVSREATLVVGWLRWSFHVNKVLMEGMRPKAEAPHHMVF